MTQGNTTKRWHVYVSGDAKGPYTSQEMAFLQDCGVIGDETLIRREGTTSWMPLKDALVVLAVKRGVRRIVLPRTQPVKRTVLPERPDVVALVHDGEVLVKARPAEVSHTGLFLAARETPFAVGQRVTVTLKAPGILSAFSAGATVVPVEPEPGRPAGFALRFDEAPEALRALES